MYVSERPDYLQQAAVPSCPSTRSRVAETQGIGDRYLLIVKQTDVLHNAACALHRADTCGWQAAWRVRGHCDVTDNISWNLACNK